MEDAQARLKAALQALEQSIRDQCKKEAAERQAEQEQGSGLASSPPQEGHDSDREEPADRSSSQFRLERIMEVRAQQVEIFREESSGLRVVGVVIVLGGADQGGACTM